jgi:septal ring-binding cell division protein DamX
VDTTATFSTAGTYTLRLTANDGALSTSDDITIVVLPQSGQVTTLETRVAASTDDAEQRPSGSTDRTSTDLELIYDAGDQTVGIRFIGVTIPQGATIVNAYVQFKVDETGSTATALTIQGQASDNPPTFAATTWDIVSRSRTTAAISWSPAPWTTVGTAGPDQRTSNLAPIVQEIVNRTGWSSGNSLVLIITGSGKRVAEAFDGDAAGAPLLHVEYTTGG